MILELEQAASQLVRFGPAYAIDLGAELESAPKAVRNGLLLCLYSL